MTLSFSNDAAPSAKRMGGWNGAISQGAAMIISGFSAGQLNGPSGGSYRMPSYGSSAPISRPW
jgi:hypothetical protein